jgi:hypothetical protein
MVYPIIHRVSTIQGGFSYIFLMFFWFQEPGSPGWIKVSQIDLAGSSFAGREGGLGLWLGSNDIPGVSDHIFDVYIV